jgi:WS/DGAT/MGAT family acyltransferase
MAIMPITDSMFLLGESREHPMHVGGLSLFELPEGAGPDHVGQMYHQMLEYGEVSSLFRRQPAGPVSSLGQWMWSDDNDLDMEYHLRLSGLARPGRVRELLELTSRLHGSLLDRHRPLWEFHVIEGLEGNRFATYSKIHHALLDGVGALRLMQSALSQDPDERDMPPPWAPRPSRSRRGGGSSPVQTLTSAVRAVGDLVGLGPVLVKAANELMREQAALVPFQAPRSMLNVPITGARRFAAQGWPLDRIKAVGRATGATLNDVMLAMCGGALRRYLLELDALPDRPLVAAVPVSLRGKAGVSDGGNAVGLILCSLATDQDDDGVRLEQITASMKRGKRLYAGLSALQITALSAIPLAALVLTPIPGALNLVPPPFNVLISNVPGPRSPLYFNGARLQGIYPLSIPYEGQALNITVTSYADSLEFGLTGCRRSVPHLQRLLGHLETSLTGLEKAI